MSLRAWSIVSWLGKHRGYDLVLVTSITNKCMYRLIRVALIGNAIGGDRILDEKQEVSIMNPLFFSFDRHKSI